MEYSHISALFSDLSKNLDLFIAEVIKKNSDLMATDEWTVKEVLCHLVFWHENYAANYQALANGTKPPILDGPGYKLNPDGVASLKKYSVDRLSKRLRAAQNSLYTSIVEKKVPQMTYKKDGRVYKTEEFLRLIARHVHTHTVQVRRAK